MNFWSKATFIVVGLSGALAGCTGQAPSTSSGPQPEEQFQQNVDRSGVPSVQLDEWRQARADHKLIAYAILSCKKMPIEAVTRRTFAMLFLDLTPDADHLVSGRRSADGQRANSSTDAQKSTGTDGQKSTESAPPANSTDATPLILTAQEQRVLSLSDSIARARITAASTIGGSIDKVWWLGLSALIIGGLTTLFVTLQARMGSPSLQGATQAPPPAQPNPGAPVPPAQPAATAPAQDAGTSSRKEQKRSWWRILSPSYGTWFAIVAFLAILFSIVGTVLAGVKQFYDPSRLIVQNAGVIQDLHRLHQAVTQGIECDGTADKPGSIVYDKTQMQKWVAQIEELQINILQSYSAFAAGASPASNATPAPSPTPAAGPTP
jgi:hypothetical protein